MITSLLDILRKIQVVLNSKLCILPCIEKYYKGYHYAIKKKHYSGFKQFEHGTQNFTDCFSFKTFNITQYEYLYYHMTAKKSQHKKEVKQWLHLRTNTLQYNSTNRKFS